MIQNTTKSAKDTQVKVIKAKDRPKPDEWVSLLEKVQDQVRACTTAVERAQTALRKAEELKATIESMVGIALKA